VPPGLNQDEVSTAYDAYAILHYGIDRNGSSLPLQLISWGSGMSSLPAYLGLPFFALFGLNELTARMVNLIFGLASLPLFYLLVRRTDGARTALLALFLLAINPWHVMSVRWGIEANLLPAFFLLSTYLLARSIEKPAWFPLAMVGYGLCFYIYGTAYFFLPAALALMALPLLASRVIRPRALWIGIGTLVLMALPAVFYVVINRFGWNTLQIGPFTIPHLPGPPRYNQISTLFGEGNIFTSLAQSAAGLARLIAVQDDGLIWNAIPGYGLLYLPGLPLLVLGLVIAARERFQAGRGFKPVDLFGAWLVAAVLLELVMVSNINRLGVLFIPLVYLLARAVRFIASRSRVLLAVVILLYGIWFAQFAQAYFVEYPQQVGPQFFESLGPAINTAASGTSREIYVTTSVNMPYIYVLFYQQIDPHEFLATVKYDPNFDEFRHVISFSRWHFGPAADMPPGAGAYVVSNSELKYFKLENYRVTQFKNYAVLLQGP
jgi:4-amino-4-deoxy-L-arabinose transferase-like glycosyltransferase